MYTLSWGFVISKKYWNFTTISNVKGTVDPTIEMDVTLCHVYIKIIKLICCIVVEIIEIVQHCPVGNPYCTVLGYIQVQVQVQAQYQ